MERLADETEPLVRRSEAGAEERGGGRGGCGGGGRGGGGVGAPRPPPRRPGDRRRAPGPPPGRGKEMGGKPRRHAVLERVADDRHADELAVAIRTEAAVVAR